MLVMLKWVLEKQLLKLGGKAVALLLLIHCLMLLPPFVGAVCFVLVFVMQCWLLDFSCLPYSCQCSVALPRVAMGWSSVCVCGIS